MRTRADKGNTLLLLLLQRLSTCQPLKTHTHIADDDTHLQQQEAAAHHQQQQQHPHMEGRVHLQDRHSEIPRAVTETRRITKRINIPHRIHNA